MITKDGFTYQASEQIGKLETYEWDNIWWEEASDCKKDRALIIGDSISCGYRRLVTKMLKAEIVIDGFGTSKAIDNPYLVDSIKLMLNQERNLKYIFVNNGLHGWHLSTEEYGSEYEKLLVELSKMAEDTKIILITTTPARQQDNLECFDSRNEIVVARNKALLNISNRLGFDVIDMYQAVIKQSDLHCSDGIHLTEEGYNILAAKIADYIKCN